MFVKCETKIVSISYICIVYKMQFLKQFISIILISALSTCLFAQVTFYNNGTVSVMPGAIMQINGNVELNGSGVNGSFFDNNGDVTVSNSLNNGDLLIDDAGNSAVYIGSGTTHLEGDWINKGAFIAQASTIELNGSNQLITGDQLTIFNNLTLLGAGVKTQTIDVFLNSNLSLNDRELATDSFTMYVLNSATSAVTNNTNNVDTGFVSSLSTGSLWWQTEQVGKYYFPLGSSLNNFKYRPIEIEITVPGVNAFAARLVNNLASIDSYDVLNLSDSMCEINPIYYHEIHRTAGSSPINLTMFYKAIDGAFDAIGIWGTPEAILWNKAGNATASNAGNFEALSISNWINFSEFPFALGKKSPEGPILSGLSDACASQSSSYSLTSNNSNSGNFDWFVNASDAILNPQLQGTDEMEIIWGNIEGEVYATETYPNGCVSLPSNSISVKVFQGPVAAFISAVNNPQLDIVDFTDASSPSFGWEWDFGDENISSSQNPRHEYDEIGTYTVMLIASDENGCVDTVYNEVTIDEGVILPIVFSPNGDGLNDVFVAANAGVDQYDLQVYNRWGELIFETTHSKGEWSGYTFGGQPCAAGTYFYVLTASGVSGEDYSRNGHVTLLR